MHAPHIGSNPITHPQPSRPPHALLLLGFFLLALVSTPQALAVDAAETERVFTVRGIIRGPLQADGTLRIAHQAIPDYMPAMTMPFNVDPSARAQAAELRPGDGVEFKFAVGETSRTYDFVRIGGPDRSTATPTTPGALIAPPASRLKEGASVPAFSLTDQQARPFTAADLRGRRTVLTFIFTRCPVPEFCPLMSKKFQSLQQRLTQSPPAGPEVRLLSITIDPEFDTPEILRAYAESYGADPARWRFVTGTPAQISALTKAFAVHTEKNAGTLDHTLATALIDPDGRVEKIWRGNGWSVDEVLTALAGADSGHQETK
jgi:protein SCO1/2